MSWYTEARVNGVTLGNGTSFLLNHDEESWLITNWHVAAGRNPYSGEARHSSLATPDHLGVRVPVSDNKGGVLYKDVGVPLLDRDGYPLWLEHPVHGRHVDVVAIPLVNPPAPYAWTTSDQRYPTLLGYDLTNPHDLQAEVSQSVSIVGFPFGRTGGLESLPIWVSGTIATEMAVEFDDRPCFLIDSRTRQGQSGSPVIIFSHGGGVALASGGAGFYNEPVQRLLGVYSGRINETTDLGYVWSSQALLTIVTEGVSGNGDMLDPEHPPRAAP